MLTDNFNCTFDYYALTVELVFEPEYTAVTLTPMVFLQMWNKIDLWPAHAVAHKLSVTYSVDTRYSVIRWHFELLPFCSHILYILLHSRDNKEGSQ